MRAEIAVVDVNSGRVSRIVTDIGARMAFPSPDGKMIAFDTVLTAKSDMRSMKPDPA